jgi:hypothetical protein
MTDSNAPLSDDPSSEVCNEELSQGGSAAVAVCKHCGTSESPDGRGLCPVCRKIRAGAKLGKQVVTKIQYRAAQFDELIAEFPPTNVIERNNIADLADLRAELKYDSVRGSIEWQRRAQEARALAQTIFDARPKRPTTDASQGNASLEQVIKRHNQVGQAIHELQEQERIAAAYVPQATQYEQAQAASQSATAPATPTPQPAAAAAEPEPKCPYCYNRTLAACNELRAKLEYDLEHAVQGNSDLTGTATRALNSWRFEHRNDPEEIARKDRYATAVMYKQIGGGERGTYR